MNVERMNVERMNVERMNEQKRRAGARLKGTTVRCLRTANTLCQDVFVFVCAGEEGLGV